MAPVSTTLSPRQEQLVNAVGRLTTEKGFPPSLAELASEIGVSICRAKSLADVAVRRGFLLHDPRTARSLRVVRQHVAAAG
jgi:SOS-response transcriptional repressor LexA